MITATGRFFRERERASDHDRVRTASERFANIAAFAHAPVGDDGNIARSFFEISVACGGAIDCRRYLGHAETKHAARSARRAWTNADEHSRRTALHDFESNIESYRVADDHRDAHVI